MPKEIALELVRIFLEPGTPTLGMWFGWNQPSEGDMVKLGSAYGYSSEDKVYWNEVFVGATLEQKKEYVSLMKSWKKDPRKPFTLQGMFEADEVFYPFDNMDLEHQMLYRLMVMSVNTCGTDYHEWSIEFGYYLASWYGDKTSASKEWRIACTDTRDERFTEDFLSNELLNTLVNVDIIAEDGDHYPEGIVDKHVNTDTVLWLEQHISEYYGDFYFWMFGVQSNQHTYWQGEVNKTLAWFVDWMIEEWGEGNLTLTPDSPSKILNKWLQYVESNLLLPGFEEI